MEYDNSELKRLQIIEKTMLENIASFCKDNHIDYFIIGGTALGAVRHGGFIPWDDDIDIGMTRKNYERFLELGKTGLSKPYFLQFYETDKRAPYPYAKVRLDNSVFSEYCNRNIQMHQGIYIDVFPYDNMPDDEKEYKKWFGKIQKLTKLYVYSLTPDITLKPISVMQKVKYIVRRMIYIILRILPKRKIMNRINALAKKYDNQITQAMTCVFFPKMLCEYGKVETLFPVKMYSFEGMNVPGPRDMELYLKNHYGDYMRIPPLEERVGHRPYELILPEEEENNECL